MAGEERSGITNGTIVAVVLASTVAIVLAAWALRGAAPVSPPAGPLPAGPGPAAAHVPAPPPPAVPAAVHELPGKAESAGTAPVMVDAIGGPATVYIGGVAVGTTPYRAELPVGSHVALELRREGAPPHPVQFDVRPTENRYAIVLRSAP